MDKLFISGWACNQSILPQHCRSIHFFDTTREIYHLEDLSTWQEKFFETLRKVTDPDTTIVAWSTGSLILLPLLSSLEYREAHLYAPCLQFTNSPNNPHGTQMIHLKSMIKALTDNRELTMKKFFRNCGSSDAIQSSSSYTTEELKAGLQFLERTEIAPHRSNARIKLYHGQKDRIIPHSAGEIVSEELHYPLNQLAGGHYQEGMFSHFYD